MSLGITGDIALILIVAFLGGMAAHLARVPLLLGYMAAGVLVGPHTAGPTVSSVHDIELLADVGVALLLFTLGLEFPLKKLAEVGWVAVLGTPLQLAFTGFIGYQFGNALGWQWKEAVWFGAMLSLSSTMVVLKVLISRRSLESVPGRVMLGVLIVQDLALLPMLIFLPALETPGNLLGSLTLAGLKAGLFVAAMLILGTRVFTVFTRFVARFESKELFQIWIAALGLGVGYITYQIGLSFAFGAFLAGMVLSESDYSHQAASDIAPLRELFSMIFFASVGMLLEPAFVVENLARVVATIGLVIVGKAVILAVLVRLFGYAGVTPLAVGLGLSQIGEFSFVLARFGAQSGAISHDVYGMILSTAVGTMILTPFLFMLAGPLYSLISGRLSTAAAPNPKDRDVLRGHVIVAGYGRVGRLVAREVQHAGKRLVVVDAHPDRVQEARAAGNQAMFGDASSTVLLQAVNLQEAAVLVLTMSDAVSVTLAVQRARQLGPDVPLICRAATLGHLRELTDMNVAGAVQPEMEGAIEMISEVLARLDVPRSVIETYQAELRALHYGPLIETGG